MTDKLTYNQIQNFQANLADKALREAQAEIDALRAENERLTLADKQWADHVKRLSEENERLRAALEELRRAAQAVIDSVNDEGEIDTDAIGSLSWVLAK